MEKNLIYNDPFRVPILEASEPFFAKSYINTICRKGLM